MMDATRVYDKSSDGENVTPGSSVLLPDFSFSSPVSAGNYKLSASEYERSDSAISSGASGCVDISDLVQSCWPRCTRTSSGDSGFISDQCDEKSIDKNWVEELSSIYLECSPELPVNNAEIVDDGMDWIDEIVSRPIPVISKKQSSTQQAKENTLESTDENYANYCPDFSDIYDESYSFWNFPTKNENDVESGNELSCDDSLSRALEDELRKLDVPAKNADDDGNFVVSSTKTKKTPQCHAEFPLQTSEFTITDSSGENSSAVTPSGVLPSITAAFSLCPYAPWLTEGDSSSDLERNCNISDANAELTYTNSFQSGISTKSNIDLQDTRSQNYSIFDENDFDLSMNCTDSGNGLSSTAYTGRQKGSPTYLSFSNEFQSSVVKDVNRNIHSTPINKNSSNQHSDFNKLSNRGTHSIANTTPNTTASKLLPIYKFSIGPKTIPQEGNQNLDSGKPSMQPPLQNSRKPNLIPRALPLVLPKTVVTPGQHPSQNLILLTAGENKFLLLPKNREVTIQNSLTCRDKIQPVEINKIPVISNNSVTDVTNNTAIYSIQNVPVFSKYGLSNTGPSQVHAAKSGQGMIVTDPKTSYQNLENANISVKYVVTPVSLATETFADSQSPSPKIQSDVQQSYEKRKFHGPKSVNETSSGSNQDSEYNTIHRSKTVRQLLEERRKKKLFDCVKPQYPVSKTKFSLIQSAKPTQSYVTALRQPVSVANSTAPVKPSVLIFNQNSKPVKSSVISNSNNNGQNVIASLSLNAGPSRSYQTAPKSRMSVSLSEDRLLEEDVDNPDGNLINMETEGNAGAKDRFLETSNGSELENLLSSP